MSDRAKLPTTHYPPDARGGLCSECRNPIPAALAGEVTTHPTCDPDWPPMLAGLKRTLARQKAAAKLSPKPDTP